MTGFFHDLRDSARKLLGWADTLAKLQDTKPIDTREKLTKDLGEYPSHSSSKTKHLGINSAMEMKDLHVKTWRE